MDRLVYLDLV